MTLPTIAGADAVVAVARDHVPERHLRPVGWNPFDARIRTLHASDLVPIASWTMLGMLVGSLVNKGSTLMLSSLPAGIEHLPMSVRIGIVTTTAVVGLLRGINGAMRLRHHNVIDAMRSRIMGLIAMSVGKDWYGPWMELRRTGGARFVEVEFRIDAIALTLHRTLRGLNGEEETRRANDAARLATRTIVVRELEALERSRPDATHDAPGRALGEFERFCAVIAGDGPARGVIDESSCEARAATLIGNAEDALSLRPDLVDRNGARIDDLVRVHLPRMVRIQEERLPGATPERRATLSMHFDHCMELARRSIEESFDIVQDERLNALMTEIRFLSMRRGDPDNVVSLTTQMHASREGGPGMTRAA